MNCANNCGNHDFHHVHSHAACNVSNCVLVSIAPSGMPSNSKCNEPICVLNQSQMCKDKTYLYMHRTHATNANRIAICMFYQPQTSKFGVHVA